MIATIGSYWLINYLNVIKTVNSSTPIIKPTLSDYQGVSQTQNETLIFLIALRLFQNKDYTFF